MNTKAKNGVGANNSNTSPKWFVTTIGSAYTFQAWAGIQTDLSFGSFVNSTQRNLTGITGDPNNVDTDGDGILDGVELLFTTWNSSAQTWTLNPLVPGDGLFDSDEDCRCMRVFLVVTEWL